MVKVFSVVSWNVKHFHGDPTRINHVVSFLKDQDLDVIALYEVTWKEVITQMIEKFPRLTFRSQKGLKHWRFLSEF